MLIYEDKQTAIHTMHPLAKFVGLASVCAAALVFSHPLFLCALAAPVVCVGALGRALAALKRVWKLMVILFLFSTVMWTLMLPGEDLLASWGPIHIRRTALLFGMGMGLRFNVMLLAGVIFVATTRVEDFTAALCMAGLPYRVSFALSLAFRLVPTFMETAVTIAQAQRCRGLDLDSGGFFARAKKYIPLIVPVFMMAVRSADNLAMALESKGFGSSRTRTSLEQYAFCATDVVAVACVVCLFVGCLAIRIAGLGGV
jgi:energy-coupling factor transport system permease protein